MDVLSTLQQWDTQETQKLVLALNSKSIVSDEDETGLSSTMVENWTDSCETFLRNNGYTGGEIKQCSKYFENHGAIYALYDSADLNYEKAVKYIVSVSARV